MATSGSWQQFNYNGMPYYVLLPYAYNANQSYPLVLFLHQYENETDEPQQADAWFNTVAFRAAFPCIVLLPICDINGQTSSPTFNWGGVDPNPQQPQIYAMALVQKMLSSYAVDPTRVYITGNSMGGLGTWGIITNSTYVTQFAAAMPLAGACYYHVADVQNVAQALKNFPIWSIHGSQDDQVPIEFDRDFAAASQAIGSIAKYTELNMGHDVWDTVYPDSTYWAWLFAQKTTGATPVPTPAPSPVPAPAGMITPTSGGSVSDASGNVWTLSAAGALMQNGSAVNGGGGTGLLTVVNGVVWAQDAKTLTWFIYQNNQFVAQTGQPPVPVPAPTPTPFPTPTPAPTPTPTPVPTPSFNTELQELQALLTQALALLDKLVA